MLNSSTIIPMKRIGVSTLTDAQISDVIKNVIKTIAHKIIA